MRFRQLIHKYKVFAICCVSALLQTSCLINSEIKLQPDGSAHIYTGSVANCDSLNTKAQINACQDRFFSSSQISGLSWAPDSIHVEFSIKAIDSAGNYLGDYFNKDYLQFRYSHDTLTVTDGHGVPFKNGEKYRCCMFFISITSDRKIKSVQTNNRFVKQKGNAVTIAKKGPRFYKEKKNTRVVIIYEK